jgi:hypothetical protein
VRFDYSFFDLRVGARHLLSFKRSFLPPREHYTREQVELREGSRARYTALEAELTVTPRLGPGELSTELSATAIVGVPEDRFVFEETLRVVVDPPLAWRARVGFLFFAMEEDQLRVGPVVDFVWLPGRDALVLRAGLLARLALYDDLEARANLVPVIAGPDSLGLSGADFAQLGVRWRWATAP